MLTTHVNRAQAGYDRPTNTFMDNCDAASGSKSSSKLKRERLAERDEERQRQKQKRSWLPWNR